MPPEAFRGLFALIIFNLRAQRNCKPCENAVENLVNLHAAKMVQQRASGNLALGILANWQSFDEMLTADLANC